MTASIASVKVADRPDQIGVYVGGGGDISGGRHALLDLIYRISSFTSFVGIWLTTAILMTSYREKTLNVITFWIIMLIPLVYFIITYFYQLMLGSTLGPFLESDPVTFSIILVAFLSLSKPIGGLIFGIAFWNTSRTVSYEKKIEQKRENRCRKYTCSCGIFVAVSVTTQSGTPLQVAFAACNGSDESHTDITQEPNVESAVTNLPSDQIADQVST
jgi:hypothetical protein